MARVVMDSSHSKGSEWASSLENYLFLQSQQDRLRRRLSITVNSPPSISPPCVSPTTRSPCSSALSSPKASFSFSSSSAVHSLTDDLPEVLSSTTPDIDEARKLRDVSQQIKLTLTDLLNCERGRTDEAFRAWIQARLMEAEHELKRQRRRHSSVDKEIADTIGEHFVGRYRY